MSGAHYNTFLFSDWTLDYRFKKQLLPLLNMS